jgi:hypothetical protein
VIEVGAVVDACGFGGGTAEDLWSPCMMRLARPFDPMLEHTGVQVTVKVDDGDRSVGSVDGTEKR